MHEEELLPNFGERVFGGPRFPYQNEPNYVENSN